MKFGTKTIEVATFRRPVPPEEARPAPGGRAAGGRAPGQRPAIRRDNSFGTARRMRSGGTSPSTRCSTTSPPSPSSTTPAAWMTSGTASSVRLATRTSGSWRTPCGCCAPSRSRPASTFVSIRPCWKPSDGTRRRSPTPRPPAMIEELYKILRSGVVREGLPPAPGAGAAGPYRPRDRAGRDTGALAVARGARRLPPALRGRARASLTNAVLLGSLAAPVLPNRSHAAPQGRPAAGEAGTSRSAGCRLARRDMEQLRRLLALQPKLTDPKLPPRQQQMVLHRGAFADALTWLEMHGDGADALGRWRALAAGGGAGDAESPGRRRRRSRRGRRRRSRPAAE